MNAETSATIATTRLSRDATRAGERCVPVEMPIAISFLGIGYAVMMATPADLDDFACGFALSERLIGRIEEVERVTVERRDDSVLVNVELVPERHDAVLGRVRHRVGESSCGMCGIANLEQALRPLPSVGAPPMIDRKTLFAALSSIRVHQPLNKATGAVHAAALFAADGSNRAIREDVGRHNAFDKLLGHCLREGIDPGAGFVLITSRCSFELVEKAALGGVTLLVTVSAPTTLAIDRARAAGLTLIALARSDEMLVVADPHHRFA